MTVKFFWKEDCPRCPAAKTAVASIKDVEYYSLDDATGLAEAAFYSVMSTPSVVISRDDGSEVVSFRGEVPSNDEIVKWL